MVFDPEVVSYAELLKLFWENHDPTQGMAQGADRGTQYRSAIFTYGESQAALAAASRDLFAKRLLTARLGAITTQITSAGEFYFAEGYHQQYLHKNPHGYCPDHATGVSCPMGLFGADKASDPASL